MTGMITWEQVIALLGIVSMIGGLWWKVHLRITAVEKTAAQAVKASEDAAHKSIEDVKDELHAYKLHAERQFASVGHLKEVERRLIKSIDGLATEIHALRTLPEQISTLISTLKNR